MRLDGFMVSLIVDWHPMVEGNAAAGERAAMRVPHEQPARRSRADRRRAAVLSRS
jgi:hypothetical protein